MFLMFSCLAPIVRGQKLSTTNVRVSDREVAAFWRGRRNSRESRIGLGAFDFRS